MDVAWLESLLSLVEHGSFTRAAEAQHLSQPAFSRRIRSLEQWVGAELVDRSTFPVTLTPTGSKLRAHAAEIVAGLAELRDDARGRRLMPRDAVRISIGHTLAMSFFSEWWTRVDASGHGISCQLLPTNTLEAYDALLHGGSDLLLAYADPAHPLGIDQSGLEWVVVATDRVGPYSGTRDGQPIFALPGTSQQPVPFITHGSGAFLGRVTNHILESLGLHLQPVVQSDFTAALVGLVRAGLGVSWLPGLAADPMVGQGGIVRIGDPQWSAPLEIRLYRRRGERTTDAAESVWVQASRR